MSRSLDFATLLTAIDDFALEEYLQGKGFEPTRARGGNEWVGDCVGCGKRKLCVDVQRRGWHCWVCEKYEDFWSEKDKAVKRRPVEGAGGIVALVKWLDGLDSKDAIEFITGHSCAADLRSFPDMRALESVLEAGEAPAIPPPENWREITHVLPYMAKRRFTMEDVRTFGLFYCESGRYANRLVFPVWESGRLIYWQARAMYEESEAPQGRRFIKALNPERTIGAAVSSEVLMNLDTAANHPRVAVVEGPADAVISGPDTVCTFGKQISPAQVRRLLQKGVRAVDLMWDGPKIGDKTPHGAWPEMVAAAPWLSTFFDLRLVFLPHGDPGEWDRTALQEQRWKGVPASHLSRLATI